LSLKHDNYIINRKKVTIILGEEIKIMNLNIAKAVTSTVKLNPNESARESENQRDKNDHSKGALSKLPDDVFTNISENYLSRKEMAHFSCVSKEIESDLNKIAQRVNDNLKNKLNQKITETKIVGIQISSGPFRNEIQKMSVLNLQKEAVDVLDEKNIENINEQKIWVPPLHWAAILGDSTLVDALIVVGADVNKASNNRDSPLHWAAMYGDATVVKALIAAGADVNIVNNSGETPLDCAKINGISTVIDTLIAANKRKSNYQKAFEWIKKLSKTFRR
tara:strand:+ start:33598 stop:34431 length:834 start_codon:yes stop_codon:yes gene_type:complete